MDADTDTTCEELRAMMEREQFYHIQDDETKGSSRPASDSSFQEDYEDEDDDDDYQYYLIMRAEDIRSALCQWSMEVIQYYGLDNQVHTWTMNYFDRYLDKSPQARGDSDLTRLLIVASMVLSSKLQVSQGCCFTVDSLVRMAQKKFSAQDVFVMETEILSKLDWLVHPPTTKDFLTRYLHIYRELYPYQVLRALCERSVTIADLVLHKGLPDLRNQLPSILAVAILFYAMQNDQVASTYFHRDQGRTIDLLPELHRHGVYVHSQNSMQCLQELIDFLEPPSCTMEEVHAYHQPTTPGHTAADEKEAVDNVRMSPVGDSLSSSRATT